MNMKLQVEENEKAPLLLRGEMRVWMFAGWLVFLFQCLLTLLTLTFIPGWLQFPLDTAVSYCFEQADRLQRSSYHSSLMRHVFGLQFADNRTRRTSYYKFRWGSLTLVPPRCEFSAKVYQECREAYREDKSSICIYFLGQALFIYLPASFDYDAEKHDPKNEHHRESRSFGISTWEGKWMFQEIWFMWGFWRLHLPMPWTWEHVRHEVLSQDMQTVLFTVRSWPWWRCRLPRFVSKRLEKHVRCPVTEDEQERLKTEASAEYTYCARYRNGVQAPVLATYYVERQTWRLRGLPFIRKSTSNIWVSFSQEVGSPSKIGSWKGGCIGAGCRIKKGELPSDTIRRMELEEVFR